MNLSLIEKITIIFKYVFSSFLSIEIFILSCLLFLVLLVNHKKNNNIIQMVSISVYLGFLIGVFVTYTSYVHMAIDSLVKRIMHYIYFPSTFSYFFIMLFVTCMLIYTLFSNSLTTFKKIFNYAFFSLLFFFFMSFLSIATIDGADLTNATKLYDNNVILSFVQVSNFILLIWIVYTMFYHLYLLFKKKYDKDNVKKENLEK